MKEVVHSSSILSACCVAGALLLGPGALAQEPESPPEETSSTGDDEETEGSATGDAAPTSADAEEEASSPPFVLGGYVEAFYQWSFARPSNRITHFRGFDNRHDTFTIANVALDAQWDYQDVVGRVTLQVGHTPSTYYLGEPSSPGAAGANASGAELWKYVQQAYAGYRFHVREHALSVSAGIYLSPIGPESMAVHDDWNWSRSDLFFGLPFYHTGVRATYAITDAWAVTIAGYNGWNSVVDGNDEKSLSAQLTFTRDDVSASLLYFGGVERPDGSPEGRAWRHLFDAYATWRATPWLSLIGHANAGFEPNRFGTSSWAAGALYARFRVASPLSVALRGDVFYEHVAENAEGRASAIFWPAPWVSSATATIDYRPHEHVSFRLEYRHDHAGAPTYFGGRVARDPATSAFVPNRRSQDTLTIGATSWF